MKIESMTSGWSITTDCNIQLILRVGDRILSLRDIEKLPIRAAQWIFDKYNLIELNEKEAGCSLGVWMTWDDIYKVSIMVNHPEIERELKEFFNNDWREYYLRFNH